MYKKEALLNENKERILGWIDENKSKAFMCKELHIKQDTLNVYLKKWEIDYKGNQGGKGYKTDPKYISAEDYSKKEYGVKSQKLLMKLVREGIRERKCEVCGRTEWNGKEIPLELHHKNGDHYNNDFDNIQIICPNCHAQTFNYSGRKR